MPKESVGFIIGKNGDTIKRLQAETGARIQFKPGKIGQSRETRINFLSELLHKSLYKSCVHVSN